MKNITMKIFFFNLLFLLCLGFSTRAYSETYAVIVNSTNAVAGSDAELKQMVRLVFLKQVQEWSNGEKAKAFNHKNDKVYTLFVEKVLGMNREKIEQYWLGKKQKTGETPPRLGPERLLSKLVAKSPGGVSYMLKSTAESSSGIKILFTFEG